jgi:hypothetical protein
MAANNNWINVFKKARIPLVWGMLAVVPALLTVGFLGLAQLFTAIQLQPFSGGVSFSCLVVATLFVLWVLVALLRTVGVVVDRIDKLEAELAQIKGSHDLRGG